MLNYQNIKLLDNYQLYELIHGKLVDKEMLGLLKEEYQNRQLSTNEEIRLKQKYDVVHATFDKEIEKNNWNPLFTIFSLQAHFQHLAKLQIHRGKKEARIFMWKLYLGLFLKIGLLFTVLYLFRKV